MLSIKAHNIIDYLLGAAFIVFPYLFGFAHVYFAHDVFTVLGLAIVGYSLLTDYSISVARAIPLSMHMTFDVSSGIFMILAPWIYGYHDALTLFQSSLHWILGIGTIALVAFTGREPRRGTKIIAPEAKLEEPEQRPFKEAA